MTKKFDFHKEIERLCKTCHHKFDKEGFKRDGKGRFK